MRRLLFTPIILPLLAVTACGGATGSAGSPAAPASLEATAAKPPRPVDIPVTAVIENVDGNGLAGDLSNDGGGAYVDNSGGVRSLLIAAAYNGLTNGDWQFLASGSTSRRVGLSLDPEDAIQPGHPAYLVPSTPPFWGTQLVTADFKMKCTFVGRSMLTMTAGTAFTCPMLNHFVYNGQDYGRQAAASFTGFAETTDVQVVCNATGAGGCVDWFIEPIERGQAIARLMQAGAKPNQPNTHIGTFFVRFRIHLTR
jgi:hypothetical protein